MKGLALATLASVIACTVGVLTLPGKLDILGEQLQNVHLKTYKFANCLPAKEEAMVVNSLELKPDPLRFPGPLSISLKVTVKQEIHAPLKVVVSMSKKNGTSWDKVPCNGIFGSCTYDNLCDYLQLIPKCPEPLLKAGFTCHCPFKAGSLSLPETKVEVGQAIFTPGDYHIRANMSMGKTIVGCYDVHVSFAS